MRLPVSLAPLGAVLALPLALAACGGDATTTPTAGPASRPTATLPKDVPGLLDAADEARMAEDWAAAGAAWDALTAAVPRDEDPVIWLTATRGSIQAQAASDGSGALERAEALLLELAAEDAVDVDLFGGLAADLKTAGALAEALALSERAREAFPDDVGLRNQTDRYRAAAEAAGLLAE